MMFVYIFVSASVFVDALTAADTIANILGLIWIGVSAWLTVEYVFFITKKIDKYNENKK